jgi:hypothetical protein
MEGLYFYWLGWLGWIWATFFMDKKNPARMKMAVWLLASIFAASLNISLFFFDINLSAFIIALFLFIETRAKRTGAFLYLFTSSFIIMLAYTSFLLFELYDPVWVLFDRRIMIAAGGVYLVLLLQKKKGNRSLSLIAGFLQGEILYSAILGNFKFPYQVSSLAFLDVLIISLAILHTWSAVEAIIVNLSGNVLTQAEGEEHKTS